MSQVLPSDRYASAERPYRAELAERARHTEPDSEGNFFTALRIGIPLTLLLWGCLIGLGYLVRWLIL